MIENWGFKRTCESVYTLTTYKIKAFFEKVQVKKIQSNIWKQWCFVLFRNHLF